MSMRTISVILLSVFCCCSVRATIPNQLACRNNIVLLDGAKKQLQIDQKLHTGDPVEPKMLKQYWRSDLPLCPAGGTYTLGPIGQEPVCSLAAHSKAAVEAFIARQPKPSFPWFVFTMRFISLGVPVFGAYFILRRLIRRGKGKASGLEK